MSPRRTRRGTIRESVIETSSIDISLKNTSKVTKRSRRTNKNHAKASEDDSDSPMEVYSSIESVTSSTVLNETSSKAKRRKRGGKEVSDSQEISLSVTLEEPKKNNAKTPRTKKQTKSNRSRTKDVQASQSEEETVAEKPAKRVSYNLLSDSEEQSQVRSRKRAKPSKKGIKTSDESPERVSSRTIPVDNNVTPKNSPALNTSFTPHRSKKTPRKSPENLGSPKTHSPSPVKFLIKPKKLTIEDSPPSSESSLNLQQDSSSNTGNESIQNISVKSSKSTKPKLNVSSSKKITPFKPKPTFSKSPKIVLKTPKAKSKKSPPKKKTPVKSDKAQKSRKSTKNESLSVTQDTSGIINFDETVTVSPSKSPKKAASTSVKSPTKANSPSKLELLSSSLKSVPKVILSSVSAKPKAASPRKSSPAKSPKTSPKSKVSFVSKGTPKIVLVKKSPVRSAKKSLSPKSKNNSPPKAKKSPSPSKNRVINTSQESSEVPLPDQNEQVLNSFKLASPIKSKKSPIKSARFSLNTSSKNTPNTSLTSRKMPKIVLKKKSPIKLSKPVTPASVRKSLKSVSTLKSTPISKVSAIKSTPVSKVKKVPVNPLSRKSSPTKNTSPNKTLSPKVVVSKLSSPELRKHGLRAKENQPSITLVPVDHPTHKSRVSSGKSPKSAASKKLPSPAKSPRSGKNVAKRSIAASTGSKPATPTGALNNKFLALKPKNTSTPRERPKPTRSPVGKSKIIKRLNDQSTIQGEQPFLEDESEPSLDESSLIRMSDVFDVDTPKKNNTFDKNSSKTKSPKASKTLNKSDTFEVDKSPKNTSRRSNRSGTFEVTTSSPSAKNKSKANNTYEVDEPKTPGFQKKSAKRTVNDAGFGEEPSLKKMRRVNFTSPARGTVRSSSINRFGTPAHPMHQRKTPISVNKSRTSLKSTVRGRINSVGPTSKTPASTPLNKRRSVSVGDDNKSSRSHYDAQLASVNRLSRPKTITDSHKKLETKTPVNRKIPNFAEIHQKNFAKMESLVDLKKRVEKRHVVLNAGSAKKAATDSTNGAYNRFGFKVRKDEAVNMISKKQSATIADTRQQKRENARSALQGVRMNRRFELQMKARTKAS